MYSPHLSQPQISHSSIPPSQQYQSHQTLYVPPIAYNTPQSLTQPLSEFPQMDSGLAVHVFNQGDDPIACEGYVARQCTQPKRPRNAAWFKEKAMLDEAQEARQILDEEQLFLADSGIPDGQAAQTTIPNTVAFQTKDLNAYDYECEKIALKQQIDSLEQKFSNQIKEKESLLQTFTIFKNESKEKESKYIDKEIDLEKKIKELDNIVYKVGQSAQTVHMLTKPQVFYDDTHKQALGYQNPFYLKKAHRIKPILYDGSFISSQHVASPVIDEEETLILEEVSRSKMLVKQNDPMSKEKKVNTTPINYVELNRISVDFGKRFVPQQELLDEQAFWLQTSHLNTDLLCHLSKLRLLENFLR
ncbi:hypothetical protein Tco_1404639 [Tanacetum coccineum]